MALGPEARVEARPLVARGLAAARCDCFWIMHRVAGNPSPLLLGASEGLTTIACLLPGFDPPTIRSRVQHGYR